MWTWTLIAHHSPPPYPTPPKSKKNIGPASINVTFSDIFGILEYHGLGGQVTAKCLQVWSPMESSAAALWRSGRSYSRGWEPRQPSGKGWGHLFEDMALKNLKDFHGLSGFIIFFLIEMTFLHFQTCIWDIGLDPTWALKMWKEWLEMHDSGARASIGLQRFSKRYWVAWWFLKRKVKAILAGLGNLRWVVQHCIQSFAINRLIIS